MKEEKAKTKRLYFVDWLRVLAMLSIFFYHTAKIFDFDEWHIKNAQTNLGASVFVEILDLWMMPLFFILSGAAVYYSLKSRKVKNFLKERSLRIALPWIFLGIFIMGPIQVYFERMSTEAFSGTLFQFIPHYFDGFYGFGGNIAWMGMHLWYLMFLFFFSVVTLPLFHSRSESDDSLVSLLARRLDNKLALLLLSLPLIIAGPLADVTGLSVTREMGTWDIFSYFIFFIYGYLLFSNKNILGMLVRNRYFTLSGVIVLTGVVLALEPSNAFYFSALRAICAWLWILALLGVGARYLNSSNKFLSYTNESVLPFYILHQTVIVIVGYFVVEWSIGTLPKYLIIGAISFMIIMIAYELIIRRQNFLRFIFGMRLLSQKGDNTK